MTLALFDLDFTLLKGDSDHAWGRFMADKALVEPEAHAERSDYYMAEYIGGRLDIHEFLAFQVAPMTRTPHGTLVRMRHEFIDARIRPMVTDTARELVEIHRQRGDTLVIITATNSFVTRPIADMFGVEHLIATELEIVDGAFTGEIVGEPCFREGKISRLHDWLDSFGGDLQGSWFYSDSRNDLPLLEHVDNPVAVNPDSVLEREANARGWPIRRF